MRTIEQTSQFKKDYRREAKGRHRATLNGDLEAVLAMLIEDSALPASYYDHALAGEWKDYRDCHIKPDLVLIYRKPGEDVLQLVRLGSHSEIGL